MNMATKPPPMDPNTDEAEAKQLDLARQQGESYRRALEYMANDVAHDGGMQAAGEYLIGYAVEEAEGMYDWEGGNSGWHTPDGENLHVEIAVCDAADGRFIPGVKVTGTLVDPEGSEIGSHE